MKTKNEPAPSIKLSRQKILTKFDLRQRSLDFIISSGLLDSSFVSERGQRVIELTPKDQFVLESARNGIYSFGFGSVINGQPRGVHALPFHRFLILRFMTDSPEDIYEELFQLGILESKNHFPLKELKKIHKRFVDRCPALIKKFVGPDRFPEKKEDELLYTLFLQAVDAWPFYSDPEKVEDLFLILNFREKAEIILTSNGMSGEIAEFLSKAYDIDFSPAIISAYRRLFYACHDLTKNDFLTYFLFIKRSERDAKRNALGKRLADVAIGLGLAEGLEDRQTLIEMKNKALANFYSTRDIKTPQASQQSKNYLDQYLKLHDRLVMPTGGISRRSTALLNQYIIEEVTHEPGILTFDTAKEMKNLGS